MTQPLHIAPPLLAWFYQNKRVLPFRTEPSPYRVWVSEIMLQQTRMAGAVPYFERFMQALPDVAALAACDEQKLLKLWEGLGYYSRARNLQKAAEIITEQYGGQLPADYDALRALPGIGDYTAGAIASIAFGLPVVAVDGNVLRVFSRLLNDNGNILHPDTKKRFSAEVQAQQPADKAGNYNEALMELGALVCTPKSPACDGCPLRRQCAAAKAGTQNTLPVKTPLKARKKQQYTVAVCLRGQQTLLQQRGADGLLAGLWQPLLLPYTQSEAQVREHLAQLGLQARDIQPAPSAKHIFTHLEWHMNGYFCTVEGSAPQGCAWVTRDRLNGQYALPNAFAVYRRALQNLL